MQVQSWGQKYTLEEHMATTPIFLPGESHGQKSLAGYNPWGCEELDTIEQLTLSLSPRNELHIVNDINLKKIISD